MYSHAPSDVSRLSVPRYRKKLFISSQLKMLSLRNLGLVPVIDLLDDDTESQHDDSRFRYHHGVVVTFI